MAYETLDYTICFNGHNVTCFEVGSIPTVGYPSLEDAMADTNYVILPDMVFEAVEDILNHGIVPTTIWVDFDPVSGHGWCNWEEETVLSRTDIAMIEESESVRKTHENRKQRRAERRVQNAQHKKSDRRHGKRRADSPKDLRRWENDEAQQERAQVMWHIDNKGDYVPRPFQRSNRHNIHMSPEQEHLNLLKVGAKRVTPKDIHWAKCIAQNATEENDIYDTLAEYLDYCASPTKEVALLTVIRLSTWKENFDGSITIRLPATVDCIDSISHNDWYKEAVRKEVPLVVEAFHTNA